MASNLLSRILPPGAGMPSVYETLQQEDESSEGTDVEERAGLALDEENLAAPFEDLELDQADVDRLSDSHVIKNDGATPRRREPKTARGHSRPRWMEAEPGLSWHEEGDDEVPQSLLVEGGDLIGATKSDAEPAPILADVSPGPGPSTPARVQWERTQQPRNLHDDVTPESSWKRKPTRSRNGRLVIDPKERAMWRWANVENLDNFLKDVYDYFLGHGIWCIVLSRALQLLTFGFVVGFSTFLTMCIDYKKVPESKTMSQILVPKCIQRMSTSASLLIWLLAFFWIVKAFQLVLDLRRLRQIHDFYLYLLDIPDSDIQTISWQEIVSRLMALRDANPGTADGVGAKQRRFIGNRSKQRMDAHDIANRLMRKENYLIALFNKDILDLTLPIPFLAHRQLFSRTLEWNLSLCILDFVFNERGQIRPLFLRDTHRRALSDGLRRRFIFFGVMNVICAPFLVFYLLALYFFRYFTEYQRNPSSIGSRQYTPLAEWKFREFNELWHLFQRRSNMSYPFASRYINQFPKDKTVQLSRFVAFVTGALASVLALASVIDPELFLGFEITPERTVLFYLGVFGTVWAVARGIVPEEKHVFDPEYALNNVVEYTHYLPTQWRGRLHSHEVKQEFSALYQYKVVIFAEELLSLIYTPFILWFSLPQCSDRLVDFFREFTVHVDGLGYVCSFALFDFKKGGTSIPPARARPDGPASRLREDYYSTKDGKMLASYYGFLDNYSTPARSGGPAIPSGPRRHLHPHAPPHAAAARHPLPTGLASPAVGPEARAGTMSRQGLPNRGPGASAVRGKPPAPARSAAGMAASVEPTASVPSLLLDPAHQPSLVGSPRPLRPRSQARYRAVDGPLAEEGGMPEAAGDGTSSQPGPHSVGAASTDSAAGLDEASNLGESWKTTRAAARDTEDEDHGDGGLGEEGAGVLGLLYQFQKTQTEGRGGGGLTI
ncbi:MAG: autophagy protein atg9 [Phylliscum demangeonii]|nr:MAG: autophagy protein atg9 [Phylliscum demangeonii]